MLALTKLGMLFNVLRVNSLILSSTYSVHSFQPSVPHFRYIPIFRTPVYTFQDGARLNCMNHVACPHGHVIYILPTLVLPAASIKYPEAA